MIRTKTNESHIGGTVAIIDILPSFEDSVRIRFTDDGATMWINRALLEEDSAHEIEQAVSICEDNMKRRETLKNSVLRPNVYAAALCMVTVPGAARAVLDVIERLTFDTYPPHDAAISDAEFKKRTHMKDAELKRAKQWLMKRRIIRAVMPIGYKKSSAIYSIDIDPTRWEIQKTASKKSD